MESGTGGNYNNYSNGQGAENKGEKNGSSPDCPDSLLFELEDIGRCPYYQSHNDVPKIDSSIRLKDRLYNNRLAIEDSNSTVIGLVPIAYNYLLECIKARIKYSGTVIDASTKPILLIEVEITKE